MKEEAWRKDFNEKEVEAFLKNKVDMEDIPIPDSLLPENIQSMLVEKTKEKPKRRLSQNVFKWGMLGTAAALFLVLLLPKGIGIKNERSGAGVLTNGQDGAGAAISEEAYGGMPLEAGQETMAAAAPKAAGSIWVPESYEQVYNLLTSVQASQVLPYSMELEKDTGTAGFSQMAADGEYLYVSGAQSRQTKILRANGEELEPVSAVPQGTEGYVKKIYQEDNLLVEIKSLESVNQTDISVYDISDREEPVLVNSLEQDGSYLESHLEDGYLYVFSDCAFDASQGDAENIQSYIPAGEGIPVSASQIFVSRNQQPSGFLFMTGTRLKDPQEFTDTAAVVMDRKQIYMEDSRIYIYGSSGGTDAAESEMLTFYCKEGIFLPGTSTWLPGITGEEVLLEANKGKLYMLTDRKLSILDENLSLTDASALFGPVDVFYIWKEDSLLTVSNGAEGSSVILSMFDISDTAQIRSVCRMEFPQFGYGDIFANPGLLAFDPENGLIGFTLAGFENGYEKSYEVVAYKEKQGFSKVFSHSFTEEEKWPGKGVFLKDYLYLPFEGGEIQAWRIK